MGEIEDILTIATLVIDRKRDPESYVRDRLAGAVAANDRSTERKWGRVQDAIRAMLDERRTREGGAAPAPLR